MARALRLRHRELHVGEEAARAALADVPLRLLVGDGGRRADGVEPELRRRARSSSGRRHADSVPLVQAVRIHEDGGPEVLVLEEVAGSRARRRARCSIRLRASALNHLDVWIRKGLPSVPKPRILGADGAGVVEALGDGVDGFEPGERVVINPGVEAPDGAIHVIGEHGDGTNAQLIAVPATNVYPIPGDLSFEEAAAFPLVFETAYRMLVTRARAAAGRVGARSGASAAASRPRGSRSRRRSARARSSRRRATRSSRGRASSAPT